MKIYILSKVWTFFLWLRWLLNSLNYIAEIQDSAFKFAVIVQDWGRVVCIAIIIVIMKVCNFNYLMKQILICFIQFRLMRSFFNGKICVFIILYIIIIIISIHIHELFEEYTMFYREKIGRPVWNVTTCLFFVGYFVSLQTKGSTTSPCGFWQFSSASHWSSSIMCEWRFSYSSEVTQWGGIDQFKRTYNLWNIYIYIYSANGFFLSFFFWRYQCELQVERASRTGHLHVTEINGFKKLVHLSVRLTQADEVQVRKTIVSRLTQLKVLVY